MKQWEPIGLKVISVFLGCGIFESFNVENYKAQHTTLTPFSVHLMQQKATKLPKECFQLIFFPFLRKNVHWFGPTPQALYILPRRVENAKTSKPPTFF